jgi:hypothetical protein
MARLKALWAAQDRPVKIIVGLGAGAIVLLMLLSLAG